MKIRHSIRHSILFDIRHSIRFYPECLLFHTGISSIEPVTSGRSSWKNTHIMMGGMTFMPNEECTDVVRRKRRQLLSSNDSTNDNMNDMPTFDSISIHRALKQHVDFLRGRSLGLCFKGLSSCDNNLLTQNSLFNLKSCGYSVEISPMEFPDLVGKTRPEADQYLTDNYGKDGYNKDTGMYCYNRNIDYNRVCYELGDNGTIISTPYAG